jgi:hypothetical protein
MMKRTQTFLLVALLALSAQGALEASSILGGTFNSLGAGTRPLGMGEAFAAVADDANAVVENPAGMAFFEKDARYATFTHSSLFGVSALSRDFIAYGQESGVGSFGGAWNRFSASFDPETWTEDELTLSAAKGFGKRSGTNFALGLNAKYMMVNSGFSDSANFTSVGGGNATGYGIGLSLLARMHKTFNVAFVLEDLYSSLNWSSGSLEVLPPKGKLGLAYHVSEQTLVSAEVRGQQTSTGFDLGSFHVGAEQWFFDGKELMWETLRNIGIRAGYFMQTANNDAGQATVGATAKAEQWQIDYAFQFGVSGSGLGGTHRFGVGANF